MSEVLLSTEGGESLESIVARLERLSFLPYHLRIAMILGVGTFFDAFDSLAIAVALTVIVTTFKINFVTAGLLISGGYLGQFIGALAFGWAGERYGRKPAFVAALAVFGLFSLLAAYASNFQNLLAMRIVQGLGLGAEVPLAGALFNEFVRGATRGKVIIVYESAFVWGLFASPLIGLALFSGLGPEHGWRAVFLVGAIPLLVALVAWKYLPESPRWLASKGRLREATAIVEEMEAQARERGAELAPMPAVPPVPVRQTRFGEMFSPEYWKRTVLIWTHWFTAYFAVYGYSVWLPLLYVRLGGLPPSRALALTIVPGLVQLILSYVVSFTIDDVGRKPWFIGGYAGAFVGTIVGFVAVAVYHNHTWPVLFAAGLLMAAGCSISAIGVYLYTPELYPTRMRAWATSTGSAANRIASVIAPAVVGAMLTTALGIGGVFIVFGLVILIGLIVMAVLGIETRHRLLEELAP
jgi:putative MFS transporter